jgi:hypothetical protein
MLTETNKLILSIIADNKPLFDAVKSTVEAQFDVTTTGLSAIEGLTDEVVGQKVRAQILGYRAVQEAFKEIELYKTPGKKPEMVNPAR